MEKLYRQQKNISDAYYDRRAMKEDKKKTGGIKSESPVWKDDE